MICFFGFIVAIVVIVPIEGLNTRLTVVHAWPNGASCDWG